MPIFHNHEQGTEEWFLCRAGHASASRFKDIIAGGKARETYMYELVAERLAGQAKRAMSSKSLEWGTNAEPLAREEYLIQTGELVELVGFATHARIKWVGASSDGLVGKDGAIEIKSPFNSGIHVRTLATGMPDGHKPQTQGNLWILEREYIDFCSYDPALPSPFNLHIERHYRDEPYIKMLEKEVKSFLAEVNITLKKLKQKRGQA